MIRRDISSNLWRTSSEQHSCQQALQLMCQLSCILIGAPTENTKSWILPLPPVTAENNEPSSPPRMRLNNDVCSRVDMLLIGPVASFLIVAGFVVFTVESAICVGSAPIVWRNLRMKKLKQAKVHTVRTNASVRLKPHLISLELSIVDPTMAPM